MTTKENGAGQTRFERVRGILRDAAEGRDAAYGGLALWEFSREKLLDARLHGVPLIAPETGPAGEEAASCCEHHAAGAVEPAGRGARSGLVQGLRGERPFDGSQFPPLPWGGPRVAPELVQFVGDWIDDGCPAGGGEEGTAYSFDVDAIRTEGTEGAFAPLVELRRTRHEFRPAAAGEYKFRRGELKQRMNVDCLDESQVERLRAAFRELYELNKWPEDSRNYNNLALVHQNHCQHGWERFLTWHRIYLYEFEQALQDHFPDVTMPYWDWVMPQYRPAQPDKGWRVPKAFQAFLTDDSLTFLKKHGVPTDKLKDLVRQLGKLDPAFPSLTRFFAAVVESGVAEKYTKGDYRRRFIDALLDANSLWYPLRYPGEYKGQTINQAFSYHYPSADDLKQIMSLRTFRDFGGGSLYNDAFGFMDQNPHNTLHLWTGGMNPLFDPNAGTPKEGQVPMPKDRNRAVQVAGRKFHKREDLYSQPQYGDMFSNLTASYDPVFWPVHANVDRLWWDWQQQHPDSNPADLDAVLTPWSYTSRDTLDMYRFGYEYVKSSCIIPVGAEVPVGRFVSTKIEVPELVRESQGEVEVRLHRVPQLPRSCFIRVFLNLPGADATTRIEDEHYAGYLAVFGHGACYGGPGHCEVPPPRRRDYDLRPRDHNTPRNHRVNVTRCARGLFGGGATSLQITLVVIGVDYEEDPELLRLEGVSLNFLD
ncbi:MAG TPA: tyrosinase family protein [Pyrinomonadaceae bacterium]|jgi:tyrosinase